MSKATKRKHVTKEVQEDLRVPTDSQSIVRLVDSRGNNLHEVVDSCGEQYLVTMPVKFRRNIWVKRGDFVLVEPIAEGDKVKAEIVKILTRDHIKFFRSQDCWPKKFDDKEQSKATVRSKEESNESSEDDCDDNLAVNTNRQPLNLEGSNDSSEDDCDDDLFVNTNRQPLNLDGSNAKSSSSESSDSD